MKKIILLLLLFFPLVVLADDKFSLECDKVEKIRVGDEVVCRVSSESDFVFDNIDFSLNYDDGLEIVAVRSNYGEQWKVTTDNNSVRVASKTAQTGLQEFAIILVKALKDGHYNLNVKDINFKNSETEENKTFEDVNQEIKIISSDNSLKGIIINDKELENFSNNTQSYNIYINDEERIKLDVIKNNEFATVKGIGEIKLSKNISNFVLPITVLSEDGISKIYTLYVYREKENKVEGLDSLTVKNDKGNTLIIGFDKNTGKYNVDVDVNTKSLTIKPEASKGYKLVKNYGEQKIELQSGNNIVIIKLENSDKDIINYVINITKPIANKSSNNYIKSLIIKDYKFSFNKRIKNYTLAIDPKDTSLEIIPILESNTARYEINGNSDLKQGSIIKITVTAENEEKTTYKINITIRKVNYAKPIIIGVLVVALGYVLYKFKDKIVKLFTRKKKKAVSKSKKATHVKKKSPTAAVNKNPRNNYTKKTNSKSKKKSSNNSKKTNNKKGKTQNGKSSKK